MYEIKQRLLVIDQVIEQSKSDQISKPLAGEFCYLQLRMCCEVIALACLLAQAATDNPEIKRMLSRKDLPEILTKLEAIDLDFYPMPVKFFTADGVPCALSSKAATRVSYPVGTRLSITDLRDLWGATGYFLHRGTLKSVLSKSKTYDFKDINEWTIKISGLLKNHRIKLLGTNQYLWATLGTTQDDQPCAAIASPAPESDLSQNKR